MNVCKSCGAPIIWVRTENGKMMPLDANPDTEGTIGIVDGVAHFIASELRFVNSKFYHSHFSTCPNAAKHRKKP